MTADLGYTQKRVEYYASQRELTERMRWMQLINSHGWDSRQVICIDESRFIQNIPRVYGCAPAGEACVVESWLDNRPYSCIAACNYKGIVAGACQLLQTSDGGVDSDRFLSWVRLSGQYVLPVSVYVLIRHILYRERTDFLPSSVHYFILSFPSQFEQTRSSCWIMLAYTTPNK